jgi:hypothetical protein
MEVKDESNQLKVVMGYIQHLPAEYQGPRHLVVRDRLPWNGLGGCLYEWEEVEAPATKDYEAAWANIMLVELVRTEPYGRAMPGGGAKPKRKTKRGASVVASGLRNRALPANRMHHGGNGTPWRREIQEERQPMNSRGQPASPT